ncbi:LamG-like jellyroll fold domain-containing protein, partial [Verrucomicrobiota bacterium]
TMTYDGTRDCLWVGYYYDDEVGKINASNGSVMETKALGAAHYMYSLDMEGADLWVADYSSQNFKKFNMDTLANTQTIGKPSGWTYGPVALARDSGQFFAAQYNKQEINRLNPSSGSVEATLPTDESFYYYQNHLDAINGKVWYSRRSSDRNRIHCMDGTSGNMLQSLEMGQWDGAAGCIYDLSFVNSTQCWMLTYNVKGDAKRWAHLVDLSVADKFSKTATSGSTAAGGTTTFTVSLDTDGLSIGWYPVTLTFASDDPDEPVIQKEIIFIVHEDAPNNAPTANAGPDVVRDIPGVTAPFVLDLDGSGSSDPNGDTLFSSWTMDGQPVEVTDKGLIELGAGTYIFELTVDDLRGGADTDSRTLTINAKMPRAGWSAWHGAYGNGHVYEPNENWLQNWPPVVSWVRTDLGGGGYGYNAGPIIQDGRVYHVGGSVLTCLAATTGGTIWQVSFPGGNPVPCVDEDRIYAGTKSGESSRRSRLYCYNKRTGAFLWKTGDIGPGGDADGSGEWISPTVHGDLVFYGGNAINKYTGEIVWTAYSAVHWERFDWGGRTLMLHSSYGQLVDPLTGGNVVYAGPSARNGEGWYTDRCVHGTNMLWSIDGVHEVAGSELTDLGDPGTVYYTQPLTLGDYGYFVQGGHGSGGTLKCVDLSDGTTWSVGGSTQLAVRDRVLSHGGGWLIMSHGTPTGPVTKWHNFDQGAVNLSELGYSDQRVFIIGSSGLTCLYVGLSKPVLENRPGTWDALTATATFNGILTNTGGVPAQVSVYWGTIDGGSDPAQWEHCESLGIRNSGSFAAQLSSLGVDQVIFYRCFATNSVGGTWAAGTERVDTYAPSCVEGTTGLLLHWPLDQDSGPKIEDMSGLNNHGALGGQHHWSTGVVGRALGFGYEQVYAPSIFMEPLSTPLTEYWSLSCWVKYEGSDRGNFMMLSYYPRSGASFVVSLGGDGYISGDGQRSTTAGYIYSGWHHLAIVRNGGTTQMYLDGKLDRSWGSRNATYRYFYVGAWTWKTFKGYLDDVRIHRRALSSTEVKALFGMRSPGGLSETALGGNGDDAEEGTGGAVTLDDASLDLGKTAGGSPNLVGVRFPSVDIPRGAMVLGASIQFTAAGEVSGQPGVLTQGSLIDYGGATSGTATVSEAGMKLELLGDVARAHPFSYTITSNTVLDFDFKAPGQAEMQGIGLDNQTASLNGSRVFMLYGWENWGIRDYDNYDGSWPNVKHYSIPVGQYYTGPVSHLVFRSDRDGTPRNSVCEFSNIIVWESGADQSEQTSLAIRGEAHDSAPAFSAVSSNLSSRSTTRAAVPWVPAVWKMRERSATQQTPDLAGIVQELVDRPGWTNGNAIAFLVEGLGRRVADAADKVGGGAPTLQVLWIQESNIDDDAFPDIWERTVAAASPSSVDPAADNDGDSAVNWHEYVAGTDADDPNSVLGLRIRMLPDGRIVVEYDAAAGGGLGYDGLDRYVTLETCDALHSNAMDWTAAAGMLHQRIVADGVLAYTNQA